MAAHANRVDSAGYKPIVITIGPYDVRSGAGAAARIEASQLMLLVSAGRAVRCTARALDELADHLYLYRKFCRPALNSKMSSGTYKRWEEPLKKIGVESKKTNGSGKARVRAARP
jgi:hypothetical protein